MIKVRNIYDIYGVPNVSAAISYSEVERIETLIRDLERKLKIAEDCLSDIERNSECDTFQEIAAAKALKQIRGEE